MNKQVRINQLRIDEGYRLDVYYDSEHYLTVGVGHLVQPGDKLNFGDLITEEQCNIFLNKDLDIAINSCIKHIKNFDLHPEQIQNELVNLIFNMGYLTFFHFKNFISALDSDQYNNAANELKDSLWYNQVGKRGKRIVEVFKNISN